MTVVAVCPDPQLESTIRLAEEVVKFDLRSRMTTVNRTCLHNDLEHIFDLQTPALATCGASSIVLDSCKPGMAVALWQFVNGKGNNCFVLCLISFHQCSMNTEMLFVKVLLELDDIFVPKKVHGFLLFYSTNPSSSPQGCTF